jgi:hypothetical protein
MRSASVLVVLVALVAAGCGASALEDTETATEAKAAVAAPTTEAAAPEPEPEPEPEAVAVEPAADNGGAWSTVDAGAQRFAAELDHASQSIASCETDMAAGADFTECAGRAYEMIVAAATALAGVIDEASAQADGDCRAALATMGGATRTLVQDYSDSIATTDWTSLDTLREKLGGDTQAYAETALAAGAACAG